MTVADLEVVYVNFLVETNKQYIWNVLVVFCVNLLYRHLQKISNNPEWKQKYTLAVTLW